MKRSGRRVALVAWYPPDNPALPPFIPNMGLYMVAAALRGGARSPDLGGPMGTSAMTDAVLSALDKEPAA